MVLLHFRTGLLGSRNERRPAWVRVEAAADAARLKFLKARLEVASAFDSAAVAVERSGLEEKVITWRQPGSAESDGSAPP